MGRIYLRTHLNKFLAIPSSFKLSKDQTLTYESKLLSILFVVSCLFLKEFEWIGRGEGGGLLERRRREFFLSNLAR
jgi:hypothetical protein